MAPFSKKTQRLIAYGLGIGMAAPRTLAFAVSTKRARVSAGLLAQVALDEVIIAAMKTPGRFPRRADYETARTDLLAAHEVMRSRGWIDDPSSYHVTPAGPEHVDVVPAWSLGPGWEHVMFESAYEPFTCASRWLAHPTNGTVHAYVRSRNGGSGPWVVAVHPFGTGQGVLGSFIFRANAIADSLDANVALIVLPLHGARGTGRFVTGTAFMTYNPVDVLLGISQSVWDVRRFLQWLRSNGAGPIALYGVSLGAHVSAIAAGLDGELAGVVAGVPTTDLIDVFARHIPARLKPRAVEHGLIGAEVREMMRVASPLTYEPLVPRERLFIFAGTGDRMSPPEQAEALWKHWREPDIAWFDTNHVAFLWNQRITRYVRESLARALDVRPAAA